MVGRRLLRHVAEERAHPGARLAEHGEKPPGVPQIRAHLDLRDRDEADPRIPHLALDDPAELFLDEPFHFPRTVGHQRNSISTPVSTTSASRSTTARTRERMRFA